MKKMIKYFSVFLFIFIFSANVSADSSNIKDYFINRNNVVFSKDEYDFLSDFYWDGIQELMTESDYNDFIDSNIMNGKLKIEVLNPILLHSSSISTAKKTLKIARSCSNNCVVSVTATWKSSPIIRSYDVIGAYLESTNLVSSPTTSVVTSTQTNFSEEIKTFNNGFGVSIKIPSTGSNIVVQQSYRVKNGGKVYASYQHATENISLSSSKNYTVSLTGYGNVFNFTNGMSDKYDGMRGVSIDLN